MSNMISPLAVGLRTMWTSTYALLCTIGSTDSGMLTYPAISCASDKIQ